MKELSVGACSNASANHCPISGRQVAPNQDSGTSTEQFESSPDAILNRGGLSDDSNKDRSTATKLGRVWTDGCQKIWLVHIDNVHIVRYLSRHTVIVLS